MIVELSTKCAPAEAFQVAAEPEPGTIPDAPPSSYLLNLGAAGEVGVDGEQVRDVLAAVAPIVETARVASGVGNVVRALGLAELAAEQQLAEGT